MEPKSGNQAEREDLYAEGLCRDCEAQLLYEELEADARRCGVCRAVAALRNATGHGARKRSMPCTSRASMRSRRSARRRACAQAGAWPVTGRTRRRAGAPVPCERSADL